MFNGGYQRKIRQVRYLVVNALSIGMFFIKQREDFYNVGVLRAVALIGTVEEETNYFALMVPLCFGGLRCVHLSTRRPGCCFETRRRLRPASQVGR